MRRLSELDRGEFQRIFLDEYIEHIGLAAETWKISRLTFSETQVDDVNDNLRARRGTADADDAIVEACWNDWDDYWLSSGDFLGARLFEDLFTIEQKFIDHSASRLWFGKEQVVVG